MLLIHFLVIPLVIGLSLVSVNKLYANEIGNDQVKNAKPVGLVVYEVDIKKTKSETQNAQPNTTAIVDSKKKYPANLGDKVVKNDNNVNIQKENQKFKDIDPEKIYQRSCLACHLTGVANAPKLGDKSNWQLRIETGIDAMVDAVINGKGAMPPKAGNPDLTSAEIYKTVEWMIEQ